jgi:cystathionine gamma-synthase
MSHFLAVQVISQTPPGGRCGLYTDYGHALAQYLDAKFELKISSERDAHGNGFPSIWINGNPVKPSDGIIVMPEDMVEVLVKSGIAINEKISAALDAAINKLLGEE